MSVRVTEVTQEQGMYAAKLQEKPIDNLCNSTSNAFPGKLETLYERVTDFMNSYIEN